jgi:hypothetical protein
MTDEPPVHKLVFAILLSSLKKGAQRIDMRAGHDAFVVDFTIDGQRSEEIRPPVKLRDAMFARIREMADSAGTIHLLIGELRHAFFAVKIDDDGPVWRCEIRSKPAPVD